MTLNEMEIMGILYFVMLILSLVSFMYAYEIVRKTQGNLRQVYWVFSITLVAFSLFTILQVLAAFNIVQSPLVLRTAVLLISTLSSVWALWNMKRMITGFIETGLILHVVSKKNYNQLPTNILEGLKNVCYISTEKRCSAIEKTLRKEGIDTKSIQFIDAHGVASPTKSENVINVTNTPKAIKAALQKILTEKNIQFVIFDNINSVQDVKMFETPRFLQEVAEEIRKGRAQGIFLCKRGVLPHSIENDLKLFVDKVEEE